MNSPLKWFRNRKNSKIIAFIDETLDDMKTRPAVWGPLPSVELQVLRLLEVRKLLTGDLEIENIAKVAADYRKFLGSDRSLSSIAQSEESFAWQLGEFIELQKENITWYP